MATWTHRIELKAEWQAAKDGDMTIQQLARVVYNKIVKLDVYETDMELFDLAESFDALADDASATADDFDCVWDDFYDWADQRVPGGKMCWVSTF